MGFPLGKAYSHAGRIVQVVPGVPSISVSDISWNFSKVRGFNYGTGADAYSWGEGNKEPGAVTLKMSKTDYQTIKASTISATNPNGDVRNLAPFNILITDTHPQAPVQNTLLDVLITGFDEKSATGDKDISVELTAIARDIK